MLESKQPNHRGAVRKNAAGGGFSELSPSRRSKKPLAMLVALAAAVALMCGAAVPAYANPLSDAANAVVSFFAGDQNADEGVSTQAVDDADHTVTGVSPRGTTINLFDYWIQGRTDNDQSNGQDWQNRGINAGHVLKFGAGMGTDYNADSVDRDSINDWTGTAEPRQGIVANKLGEDGYPSLSGRGGIGTESLDYLFDSSSLDGKAAYSDVDGLLQVDEDGYYYYNSQENFAQFNDDGDGSGDFTLYNKWAVYPGGSSPQGQFFPFNTGTQVFNETNNGIESKNIKSTNEVINHYFGMHMSTRFVQQDGGYNAPEGTAGRQEVTYNFSGDDDVWIFIDGVLVGDLGGIHDATSIEINFANNSSNSSGRVYIYDDGNGNNQYDQGERIYNGNGQGETLAQIMTAAGVTANLDGGTFADGTYHTLDFFYLERGNTDSNMSLKYNLVNIPESGIVKVDQYGTGLSGIEFTLQQANANYEAIEGTTPVTGRTNSNGEMIFTYENNAGQEIPITLEQLGSRSGYWILTETIDTATNGYRSVGTVKLRFSSRTDNSDGTSTGDGVLLSSNQWETGAYSQAHVTATATTTVTDVKGSTYDSADGLMFAVVTKINDGEHYAVTGDAFSGWDVATTAIDDAASSKGAIVDAAKTSGYIFLLGSGGAYQTTIEDLPGDITTYEYMIKNGQSSTETAQYAVKYYWSNATSLDNLSASSTIVEINPNAGQGFDRMFSVTLSIPNIKNELTLHKTNADGTEDLQGAVYALYADANGNGKLDDGEQLVAESLTTDEHGMVEIYSNVDEKLLANGKYVLVETVAPTDYVLDDTPIQIVVDDDGVHVNAGTADDNISVETGIGDLVYSMRSFAADDQIDATLHEVQAQPETATAYEGEQTAWNNAGDVLHFQYQDETDDNRFTYQPSNGGVATYTADAGWSRFNVTQCMSDEHEGGNNTEYKQELGSQSLNGLFTGDVIIHVTNEKVLKTSGLTITKTVDGTGAPEGKEFTFDLQVKNADGTPVTGEFFMTHSWIGGAENEKITLVDGQYQFKLKSHENFWIAGLPVGATYTVTETAAAYYNAQVLPGPGTLDEATGNLSTTGTIEEREADNVVLFRNTFEGGSVDYTAHLNLTVSKKLNGRDMGQGEFSVIVDPSDDASAKLFGLENADENKVISMPAASDSVKATVDILDGLNGITFTAKDAGKKFTYTVYEQIPAQNPAGGVTYDTHEYTLTIEVSVDGEGVVSAKTVVSNETGVLRDATTTPSNWSTLPIATFVNTYKAEGQLGGEGATSIKAHKTLENDTLAGDDFTFSVWSVNQDGDTVDKLVEAKNDADGDIVFPAIVYTTDTLKSAVEDGIAQKGADADGNTTYTYVYRVMEDTTDFAKEGLTTSTAQFNVTVVVTDNGDGTLGIEVTYPQGYENGLEFVNTYGEGASANLAVAGTKIYETNGFESAPDITGEYTFTLTGVDEDGDSAPLPAGAVDNAVTATNQPANSVSFGTIEYDIEDLKGKDSIKFTYTVTEEGSVAGVENDSEAATGKTFEVTLIDNGDGTIRIDDAAQQAAGQQFSFTNAYDADPTVPTNPTDPATGNLTITKTLDGRALEEGEFSFTMSANGEYGEAVSPTSITATNTVNDDGTGSVVFGDGFTFTESGDYSFTISEDNNGLGGVDYDEAMYTAVAHVKDDGAGALTVTWTVADAEGNEVSDIAFANTYKAEATSTSFGVSKELKGGTLAEGQFSFELTGSEGAPMPEKTTVTNAADGSVSFGEVTYEEVGEYDYAITEVNDGQDGIVYDENVDRTVHVSVTDNGEGSLVAEVTYGEDGSHFVNEDTTGGTDPGDDPGKDPGENPGGDPGDGNGNGGDNGKGNGSGNGYQFAQTNDATPWPLIVLVAFGAAAMIVVTAFGLRRARR